VRRMPMNVRALLTDQVRIKVGPMQPGVADD
jgi:hypothetical protein